MSQSLGGVGLSGLIFIVFLALKLAGIEPVAAWSWWWVTAPLWIGWLVLIVCFVIALLVYAVSRVWDRSGHRYAR